MNTRSEQVIGRLFSKVYSKCTPSVLKRAVLANPPNYHTVQLGGAVLANPPNYHTVKVRLWGTNYIKVRFLERTFFIPVLWV